MEKYLAFFNFCIYNVGYVGIVIYLCMRRPPSGESQAAMLLFCYF